MKFKTFILLLIVLLALMILFSLSIGPVSLSLDECLDLFKSRLGFTGLDINKIHEVVLYDIRLPRVLGGAIIGAALSIAGAAMQGLFKNPLADPGLIGISSGASLSASLIIVLGVNMGVFQLFGISFWTFVGASLTTLLVFSLSQQNKETSVATMLLAGIAINAICGSVTGLLTYVSDDEELRSITFWLMGSLAGIGWSQVWVMLIFILPSILILVRKGKSLNAFMLGDLDAKYMGVDTKKVKLIIVIATTLCVGTAVANSGMIGFVGLVIPHICRMMVGSDNRTVLPLSALLGALLIISSDLLCRTVLAPAELPIGVVTSIVGSPIFLSILIKEKRKKRFAL